MNPAFEATNAYEILGVPRSADLPAIRRAFRALALMHHPDARPAEEKDEAARFFARINRAHDVLRDPEKRRAYDARLDRGERVDLDQDLAAGATTFARLAEILGQVKSFGFPEDSETLLGVLGGETRDTFLKPMLISGNGFAESVADVLPVQFSEADPWLEPLSAKRRESLGGLVRASIVVTNLRLILVASYAREEVRGETAVIKTSLRARGIPYEAIRELTFEELGDVSRTYRLDIRTDEGSVRVQVNLGPRGNPLEQHFAFMAATSADSGDYPASRFSRLLLIAHAHALPLRVAPGDAPIEEYGAAALGAGCAPVVVWAIPFVAATLCGRCAGDKRDGCFNHWPAIARFMDDYWLTTVAAIAVPILIARRWIEIFRAGLRRPAEILARPGVKR